jgi:hypothetical protein
MSGSGMVGCSSANGRKWRHGPRRDVVGHSLGPGQSASIPIAAAASTARHHASAGVPPSTRIRFSPFDPSTCQTIQPELPVNAASPQHQPDRRRKADKVSGTVNQKILKRFLTPYRGR